MTRKKNEYGARLIASLQEAVDIERGVAQPSVRVDRVITARAVMAAPAPRYSAGDVKLIRQQMGLSQTVFGEALNVSAETVRAWEQGKKRPSGPAERLLEIASERPAVITANVRRRGVALDEGNRK